MNQTISRSILILDLFWIAMAFALAYAVRYQHLVFDVGSKAAFRQFFPDVGCALLIWIFLYLSKNLDGFRGGWHLPTVISQIMVAVFYLMALLLAVAFLQKNYYSRLMLLYLACLLPIGFIAVRCFARWVVSSWSWSGSSRRAVILGSGQLARELAYKIARHPEILLEVVGLLYPSCVESPGGTTPDSVSLQSLDIITLFQEKNVKELIVVKPQLEGAEADSVISRCREAGIVIRLVPDWYELYISHAEMIEVDGLPLISLEGRTISAVAVGLKRAIDLAVGLFLFILCAPIVLISVVILKRRRGQGLRKETRCGRMGTTFSMFRLNVDRENQNLGGMEKLLLRLSLAELPQLWNILRGEMSLVGPRPETSERVRHYSDWQRQRLSVRPGLTGLAQVHGLRDQHSSEEKARFDLEYIFHWSLFLDFSLILQTAWTLAVRLLTPPQIKNIVGIEVFRSAGVTMKETRHADSTQPSAD